MGPTEVVSPPLGRGGTGFREVGSQAPEDGVRWTRLVGTPVTTMHESKTFEIETF